MLHTKRLDEVEGLSTSPVIKLLVYQLQDPYVTVSVFCVRIDALCLQGRITRNGSAQGTDVMV